MFMQFIDAGWLGKKDSMPCVTLLVIHIIFKLIKPH